MFGNSTVVYILVSHIFFQGKESIIKLDNKLYFIEIRVRVKICKRSRGVCNVSRFEEKTSCGTLAWFPRLDLLFYKTDVEK